MTFYSEFKTSKFGNRSTEYNGRMYHSAFEAEIAAQLNLAKRATEISERVVELIPQYKVDLSVNGIHITNYYVDFYAKYADGREELVEVKGFSTETWLMKWRLLEAIYSVEHPNIKLRLIKQKSNYRRFASLRKNKINYGDNSAGA